MPEDPVLERPVADDLELVAVRDEVVPLGLGRRQSPVERDGEDVVPVSEVQRTEVEPRGAARAGVHRERPRTADVIRDENAIHSVERRSRDHVEGPPAPRSERDVDGTRAPRRVLNQLLAELDGMEERSQVIVIGATNSVGMVDPAALRPGRFGVHLYVGLPDEADRAEILAIHLRKAALEGDHDRLTERLVGMTDGLSGADLAFLCQAAKLHALQRGAFMSEVALVLADFEAAISEFSRAPNDATNGA